MKRLKTQNDEVKIASMSMQNNMLDRMIERYEKRSEQLCLIYNEQHSAWMKVDALLSQKEDLMTSMQNITSQLGSENVNTENILPNTNDNVVVMTLTDGQVGNEVVCLSEDIQSTMTTATLKQHQLLLQTKKHLLKLLVQLHQH